MASQIIKGKNYRPMAIQCTDVNLGNKLGSHNRIKLEIQIQDLQKNKKRMNKWDCIKLFQKNKTEGMAEFLESTVTKSRCF